MKDPRISELISDSYETAVSKGWWDGDDADQGRNPGTMMMLMVTELAEAFEEHRAGRSLQEIWYNEEKDNKPEGIPVEFADVLIRIADYCGKHDIPLVRAVEEKLAFNKTRPYRHGGKVV